MRYQYYELQRCWGPMTLSKMDATNRRELELSDVSHVDYDMIKRFAASCQRFIILSPKKGQKPAFSAKKN